MVRARAPAGPSESTIGAGGQILSRGAATPTSPSTGSFHGPSFGTAANLDPPGATAIA